LTSDIPNEHLLECDIYTGHPFIASASRIAQLLREEAGEKSDMFG
jgi:hypothetical protein